MDVPTKRADRTGRTLAKLKQNGDSVKCETVAKGGGNLNSVALLRCHRIKFAL